MNYTNKIDNEIRTKYCLKNVSKVIDLPIKFRYYIYSIERSFAFITHFRLTKCRNNVYLFMYVYYVSVFIVVVAASSLAARKISMRPATAHLISIIMKTKVKTKRRKQINTKP